MAGRPGSAGKRSPALPVVFTTEPYRLGALEATKQALAKQKADVESLLASCGACGAAEGGSVHLCACDACSAVRYCGRECQRADWAAHRLVCGILATDREIAVSVYHASRTV